MKICVTCASGVEAVTKREIYRLFKIDAPAISGRICFEGDWEQIAKCNLYLRTANRVGIILGEFNAETFDELFEGIKEIQFENFIPKDGKIIVTAKNVLSKLFAISATQSISKKAICERLTKKYGVNTLAETGERYKIEVAILKDHVTVTLDTSGEGLHRRGYRGLVGEAPLKETLASAMIDLSVWNPDRPLADVFCGSGTIPIEACLIALNIASGKNRSFDFTEWKDFDKEIFNRVKEEAIANERLDREIRISGFDIDENQLKLARRHAKEAGVEKYIHFQKADMRDFASRFAHGVIISNPPYGERLLDRKGIESLYRDYGKMVRSLDNWCAYTLTSVTDFERLFGKKADKKRKLYNGKLECNFYAHLGESPKKPNKN
ncbi:MAG: class I SAM-dependent RNA methyltransferase [Clostridiales bacterium]|nr:class I SAM-dependent RNA methyltransferase [Clostridiales bacterium]